MRSKGFFTFAQNNSRTDYVRMAYALSLSLKLTQVDASRLSIGITPGTKVPDAYSWAFDQIIEIPWGDLSSLTDNKIVNEWKAIHMSPYDETIKLDADMIFTRDIDAWWELMSHEDFWICNHVLDRHGNTLDGTEPPVFRANRLPRVRTAIMKFDKTAGTYEIFKLSEQLFTNWRMMGREVLGYRYSHVDLTTDMAMAISLRLTDVRQVWDVENPVPTFIEHQGDVDVDVSGDGRLTCSADGEPLLFPIHHRRNMSLVDAMISSYEGRFGRSDV